MGQTIYLSYTDDMLVVKGGILSVQRTEVIERRTVIRQRASAERR